jgi:hypothetical protein
MLDKQSKQLFWVMGAIERLQGLGFILGSPRHVIVDKIDEWNQIDSERHELMDDESLESATAYICETNGAKDEDAAVITEAVFSFRDRREDMVKFAMKNNLVKN